MKVTKLLGPSVTAILLVVGLAATDGPSPQVPVESDQPRYQTPEKSPFLEHYEVAKDVWAAVHKVLAAHRFTRPSIVIRGDGGVIWFTVDRILEGKVEGFESFDRVFVGVAPSGPVQSRMVAYVRGPSDWALRGTLLGGDLRSEAFQVSVEVASALRGQGK